MAGLHQEKMINIPLFQQGIFGYKDVQVGRIVLDLRPADTALFINRENEDS